MKATYANVVATAALILAVGGTAFAGSGGGSPASSKLRLCAAKKSGDLRLLSSGGRCKSSERAMTIDRRGTKGATGATGPAGPAGGLGERGPQGEPGTGATGATVLKSPDGRFTVSATNSGIYLAGPAGTLSFDGTAFATNKGLSITVAENLDLTGSTMSFTGGDLSQTVDELTQVVGANASLQVGGPYSLSVGSTATFSGPQVHLGGSSCPQPAARVGSGVAAGVVTGTGSSTKVFVC